MSDITDPQDAPGGAGRFVLPVLFGAVIALAGFSGYLFMQLNHVRADIAKLRESIMTEIANLREASSATTEANRRHLDTLREDLETARRNAAVARAAETVDTDAGARNETIGASVSSRASANPTRMPASA